LNVMVGVVYCGDRWRLRDFC